MTTDELSKLLELSARILMFLTAVITLYQVLHPKDKPGPKA